MVDKTLTQKFIKSILRYNEDTGEFTWIASGRKAGKIHSGSGYTRITLPFYPI